MDVKQKVIRKVFFPLWMMKSGNRGVLKYLHCYKFIDELSPDQILQRQFRRLRSILCHAYEATPYYRDVFDSVGFLPYEFGEPAMLSKIPLLTKQTVRANLDKMIATNIKRESLVKASTGGSTGVPMSFFRDKECIYQRTGQELYFDDWMGYGVGEKMALFVAGSHFDGVGDRWKAIIRNATCERMIRFDPYHITDQYMLEFAQRYGAFRPKVIKSFPNALATFAEFVGRNSIELPKVNAIACTGENLYPQQRQLFEKTFGGEVFERYGTKECGVIASECRYHKGMHIFTEGVYVEVLDVDGRPVPPGEIGRIVVTDLFNRGVPLIRYEIGDMGVVSDRRSCDCGCPLPLLKEVLGRDRDVLYDSFGNPRPGYLFVEAINELNLNAQFQIVQTDEKTLKVKVVKQRAGELDIDGLRRKYHAIMGDGIRIEMEFTEKIERDPSGKYRYVISECDRNREVLVETGDKFP